MSDINAVIDEQVKSNDVFLYMKGTPDFPMCGFSSRVVQILDYLGVDYKSANVLENQELREGIKAYTNWPTSRSSTSRASSSAAPTSSPRCSRRVSCSRTSPKRASRSNSPPEPDGFGRNGLDIRSKSQIAQGSNPARCFILCRMGPVGAQRRLVRELGIDHHIEVIGI